MHYLNNQYDTEIRKEPKKQLYTDYNLPNYQENPDLEEGKSIEEMYLDFIHTNYSTSTSRFLSSKKSPDSSRALAG
ncbi:MAG: hypothetical protein IRD7MM_05025 [Candidatus Midichloria mitochondrii]|uniref:hypothetical protein n=1 Tax=Candidatus Midichloria mitochondrii TaxID=234827 RepID=UPI0003041DA8|nr:hypothetical protein [Candidatus Midichloria mitochondrii]MDJ1255956.1 hypothetical protein [Candidatus Midichloria mitochondrii]MDJ1287694.1 hypothetical protein [Candidatus Midichloria mitochondrii]MDJ1298556.1 hypothetical protein [Candidatus Midichloria mitochondrii]MDJ1312686.1 hypothetical protein [Candidatus Midichloria mitochondrii]MDJ1583276.1 hypothetical protein [Candidatus Midichloria mitochondrii]